MKHSHHGYSVLLLRVRDVSAIQLANFLSDCPPLSA
jgi:hypothetical protein